MVMTDREKVKKGLECCSQMSGDICRKCPYWDECHDTDLPLYGIPHLAGDALELIRHDEQTIASLQHTINELTKSIAEQWHPFDPTNPDGAGLRDHFFYLVTVKGKGTPMKAMCHTDLPWKFRAVDGNFDPFDVIGWQELPEVMNDG